MEDLLLKAQELLANPVVASVVALVLASLLPESTTDKLASALSKYLQKFPVLGTLVKVINAFTGKLLAQQVNAKIQNASDTARVLVQAAEQLKHNGVYDNTSAAVTVTKQLEELYKLDTATARRITEAAVFDLKQWSKPLTVSQVSNLGELPEISRPLKGM